MTAIDRNPGSMTGMRVAAADLLSGQGHEVEDDEPVVDRHFADDFIDLWSMIAWGLVANGTKEFGPEFAKDRLDPLTLGLASSSIALAWSSPSAARSSGVWVLTQ
jgi:amidase